MTLGVAVVVIWLAIIAGFVLFRGLPESCRVMALWLLTFARKLEEQRAVKAAGVDQELLKEA